MIRVLAAVLAAAGLAAGFALAPAPASAGGHPCKPHHCPSPAPSPSPTGTGAACVTSAAMGICGPYAYPQVPAVGAVVVGNNVWGPVPGWSQVLTAYDPGNWSVAASMPAGGTSVVSFPNTGLSVDWVNGVPPPLSGWSSVYSSFSESLPAGAGTVAEAGYDIWLNNWADEVMIQTDFAGDAARPRCDQIGAVIAVASFGGAGGVPVQDWDLCQFGSELIWQLPTGVNEPAGSVDVLAMLTWLEDHGGGSYLPPGSGLTDVSFGFEICSTGGVPETFGVSAFSVTVSP